MKCSSSKAFWQGDIPCQRPLLPASFYVPDDLPAVSAAAAGLDIPGGIRAIMPIGKNWPNGSTLRVRFMGGRQTRDHQNVSNWADEWTHHANLKF